MFNYIKKAPNFLRLRAFRGPEQIRTAVDGFADHYLTTRSQDHLFGLQIY